MDVLQYRILLNGFGYALFGVPPGDLETTWRDETIVAGRSPLLGYQFIPTVAASTVRNVRILNKHDSR